MYLRMENKRFAIVLVIWEQSGLNKILKISYFLHFHSELLNRLKTRDIKIVAAHTPYN